MNGVGPVLGDGVANGVGDWVSDGRAVGEGEFVGQGVGVSPPVAFGVAAAEPHAPTMMTVIMAAPKPRSRDFPACVGAGTISFSRAHLANMVSLFPL